jgi:probable HAF family extracellular repeat protein
MIKASFSVRPRMYANGAISITFFSRLWEQTRGRPDVTIGRFVTNALGNTLGNTINRTASQAEAAIRWTDLGTLGGANSQALAINNDGIVVGWSSDTVGETRAFLYRDGAMRALPDLGGAFSRANAIDDTGLVAGAAGAPDGISHAVLWENGQVLDLNTLIPTGSGWVLHGAIALSDSGRIIGYGAYHGEPRAFMLTP